MTKTQKRWAKKCEREALLLTKIVLDEFGKHYDDGCITLICAKMLSWAIAAQAYEEGMHKTGVLALKVGLNLPYDSMEKWKLLEKTRLKAGKKKK